MIEETITVGNDPRLATKSRKYIPNTITDQSALRKDKIVGSIISEGAQLSLLGTLVEQIGDKVGLDTPEFTYAKDIFEQIKAALGK